MLTIYRKKIREVEEGKLRYVKKIRHVRVRYPIPCLLEYRRSKGNPKNKIK